MTNTNCNQKAPSLVDGARGTEYERIWNPDNRLRFMVDDLVKGHAIGEGVSGEHLAQLVGVGVKVDVNDGVFHCGISSLNFCLNDIIL